MATITWKQNPVIAEALSQETSDFEFEQAVSILEQMNPRATRLGEGSDPEREGIDIKSHVSLATPSAELYQLQKKPDQKPTLWMNILGLAGIHGPLPMPYTEMVIQRNRQKDFAFRDFLDIFNHRLVSLWYRFRKKVRLGLSTVYPEFHPIGKTLLQLVGIQQVDPIDLCLKDTALTPPILLRYHDLLWHRTHSAEGLVCLLSSYFKIPVKLDLFQGEWKSPKPDEYSFIGCFKGSYNALGQTMILGTKVWEQTAGITLTLGPLTWETYQKFLPSQKDPKNSYFKIMRDLCTFYYGIQVSSRLRLILKKEDLRPLKLDGQFCLGWNSWILKNPPLETEGCIELRMKTLL